MAVYDFQILKRGTISRITGKPGSGKTHGALMLIERTWKRFRAEKKKWPYKVLTNIVIDWDKYKAAEGKEHPMRSDIIQVTSLKTLYWEILETRDAVLVLDEAGLFGSSGAAGVRKALGQWEQILKLCRKLGMAIIWIDQRGKGSIPPTVRELCSWHIHKPSKTRLVLKEVQYLDDGRDAIERKKGTWKYFGGVTIPFDTHAPGSFDMELGEKAVIKGKKEVWIPITTADVYNAVKSCKEREIRPTLKEFLLHFSIAPDRADQRANNRVGVPEGRMDDAPKDLERRGGPRVRPQAIDCDKGAVYAILDRYRANGLSRLPLPREIQAALPWMYAPNISRYISDYCKDKGIEKQKRRGGHGGSNRETFEDRVKRTRAEMMANKAVKQ